ncbi:MAG: ATP-binding cassette domain-containing protein [Verrucomicrobiota bacterium]|nr:ATP-binding cassette domain-containing protein [Verrucomicrobiota bacterium]
MNFSANFSCTCQRTGVFGPSGSGKTTLLEIIAGLVKPDTGSVSIMSQLLCNAAEKIFVPPEKRRIGYVPQDLALFPHLTVRKNLHFACANAPDHHLFDKLAGILEITEMLDRVPGTLSGGEQQRVAIGRALMSVPQLLLLDEPLSHLDAHLKQRSLIMLREIQQEFRIPILYVSHDSNEIRSFCDEVLILQNGSVTAQRPAQEL